MLDSSTYDHLTVCKQMKSNLFKNEATNIIFGYKLYI